MELLSSLMKLCFDIEKGEKTTPLVVLQTDLSYCKLPENHKLLLNSSCSYQHVSVHLEQLKWDDCLVVPALVSCCRINTNQ